MLLRLHHCKTFLGFGFEDCSDCLKTFMSRGVSEGEIYSSDVLI